jgi:hypothetical protein
MHTFIFRRAGAREAAYLRMLPQNMMNYRSPATVQAANKQKTMVVGVHRIYCSSQEMACQGPGQPETEFFQKTRFLFLLIPSWENRAGLVSDGKCKSLENDPRPGVALYQRICKLVGLIFSAASRDGYGPLSGTMGRTKLRLPGSLDHP